MGAASSKIEEDKAVLLCRERRRFVRQALDGRCSLAAAHVRYIQALRNVGIALAKFVEPEASIESSLYTSTSATPEPLVLTEKSHFSSSSQSLSHNVDAAEPFSPIASPLNTLRYHANHMKSARSTSTIVQEKPPVSVTLTVKSSSIPSSEPLSHVDETSNFDSSPPRTPPWDYFALFHPIEPQLSFQNGKEMANGLDTLDDIKRLREEEGIPDLEEEADRSSMNVDVNANVKPRQLHEEEGTVELEAEGDKLSVTDKSEYLESEDDFDQPSAESLVRIYKNRNDELDLESADCTAGTPSRNDGHPESKAPESKDNLKSEPAEGSLVGTITPDLTPKKSDVGDSPFSVNRKSDIETNLRAGRKIPIHDLTVSIKEIEELFIKASEAGKNVPRMLEANKIHFRPLHPEGKESKPKGSTLLPSCFVCCQEETYYQEETTTNEIKYLTWHRSISSQSSSSQVPLAPTARQQDFGDDIFSGICMNSGSHASTLDRLYAWERKLYDEVKASGIIRKDYDMKCKLLRQQESRGENVQKIDNTRAKVKDLHCRIKVAIHRIDKISKTIEEIRDKELQPQLEELIEGLFVMWTTMLECHKRQHNISEKVTIDDLKNLSKSDSRKQAAIKLQTELSFMSLSFTKWISAHKFYLQSINDWLLKCVSMVPTRQRSSKRRAEVFNPARDGAPTIFITCQKWLTGLSNLPTKEVATAIKGLASLLTDFMPHKEKKSKILNVSLSGNFGGADGLTEELLRNGRSADWNTGTDDKSHLEVFLKHMMVFSEQSVKIYGDLSNTTRDTQNENQRSWR